MKTVSVNLKRIEDRSYPIYIEDGLIEHAEIYIKKHSGAKKFLIVSNPLVYELYAKKLKIENSEYFLMKDGEKYKTLETYEQILNKAIELKLERKDAIIALGGGVVGDVAGFAAATYLRGVDFIQIPTTLLAQVDSSVGGKVAVDHHTGKNLIGAFYQPKVVLVDPLTLNTLDERQLKTGWAEVIKYVFIEKSISDTDYGFFNKLLNGNPDYAEIIETCCKLKAEVVMKDEFEQGIRAFLNFGHTFGHALEKITDYESLTHGEAVAIGMKMAFLLALNKGLISKSYFDEALSLFEKFKLKPEFNKPLNFEDFKSALQSDKKVKSSVVRFVLPVTPQKTEIFEQVSDEELREVFVTAC